jgi:TPR repeat protein
MNKWAPRLTLAAVLAIAPLPSLAQPGPAQSQLAPTLLAGSQAPAVASALLEKANSGDAASQVLVGESYAACTVAARNPKQAAECYRQAADWYRKAADHGDLSAQIHLASLYREGGKGFPRDMEQAAAWYRKAAEQGDVGAQGILGVLYSIGQGVPQDDVEAYYWLDLAAAVKGPRQQQYAANRQTIGTHITADELAEVQDRVAQWLAAHPRPGAAE